MCLGEWIGDETAPFFASQGFNSPQLLRKPRKYLLKFMKKSGSKTPKKSDILRFFRRISFWTHKLGGGEGSRTPVRKHFLGTFSGRRQFFTFPHTGVSCHTPALGRVMMRGRVNSFPPHGRHSTTPSLSRGPLKSDGCFYLSSNSFKAVIIVVV